jgi:NAD-dependent deacetylase
MESKDIGTNTAKSNKNHTMEAVRYVKAADSILVFTGAGISAESGIPTFREAQTGLWAKYNPQELASPQGFKKDPYRVLSWYQWRLQLIKNSEPNPGHHALVELEEYCESTGKNFHLITQNIDGLHQQAGSSRVIELHGNIFRLRCQSCSQTSSLELSAYDLDRALPRCSSCSNLLRPDVVWFGEGLPEQSLNLAWEKAARCDVFFSIGTSTLVQPAASLPFWAVENGAILIELNPELTPASQAARIHFSTLSGEFLPHLIKEIKSQQP